MIIEYGWLHAFLISRVGDNRIKGVYADFRCGCEAVFHWNGVLYMYKNSENGYFIALTLEESSGAL